MSATDEGIGSLFYEYGVTPDEGYVRPHIDEIWDAAVREAEQKFGKRLTAPTSAELQYVEVLVLWADTFFETQQANYYAAYYETAQGLQLDRLLALMGFERLEERQATGEVTISATGGSGGSPADVTIPAGTRVATERGESSAEIIFETTEPAVILAGEVEVTQVPVHALDPLTASLSLSDEQTGIETNVPADAITRFIDAVQGVSDVTNPLPTGDSGERADGSAYDFVVGRDRETDVEFKRRYEAAQAAGGAATLDAIEAAIRTAGDGDVVQSVAVNETIEITQDADGNYQGRHVEPTVYLAEDTTPAREDVAQAIIETRAAGIKSVGSTTVYGEREDGTQHNHPEGFDIATEIPIFVDAALVIGETFPADGIERIKQNIVELVGGETAAGERVAGTISDEPIGTDVYYSQVVGAIMDEDIPGITDVDGTAVSDAITLGTADSPAGTSNITVAADEIARARPSRITITTTSGEPQ